MAIKQKKETSKKSLKKERKEVEVVDDVICNKCGCSMKISESGSDEFYGLVGAVVCGGYFSEELEDGVKYSFDLCEKCLKEMFKEFKVKVDEEELF